MCPRKRHASSCGAAPPHSPVSTLLPLPPHMTPPLLAPFGLQTQRLHSHVFRHALGMEHVLQQLYKVRWFRRLRHSELKTLALRGVLKGEVDEEWGREGRGAESTIEGERRAEAERGEEGRWKGGEGREKEPI